MIPFVNSVIPPAGVIRPTPVRLAAVRVNQRLPSGPAAIPWGLEPAVSPLVNSVTVPVGVEGIAKGELVALAIPLPAWATRV